MGVGLEHDPLFPWLVALHDFAWLAGQALALRAAIGIGTGIDRPLQEGVDGRVIGRSPCDQAAAQAIRDAMWQGQLVFVAVVQDAVGAAQLAKEPEDQADGVLHLAIGGEHDPAIWQAIIPYRQA